MFFLLSKIFWALAQPLNALCLLALCGLVLRVWKKRAGQIMMNASLCLILILGILPVGPAMVYWLERQYPAPAFVPTDLDGIIVLGGAFDSALSRHSGQIAANDQIDRMFCFLQLANANPGATLVFSGGAGDILNPGAMEGDDARAFLSLAGLDRPVLYEEKSRNTYENARFTKDLVKPADGQVWAVTTSAFHMPRTMGIFEKLGWPVTPYACDPKTAGAESLWRKMPGVTGNFALLNLAVKELIGSVIYTITGKSAFILPPAKVRLSAP